MDKRFEYKDKNKIYKYKDKNKISFFMFRGFTKYKPKKYPYLEELGIPIPSVEPYINITEYMLYKKYEVYSDPITLENISTTRYMLQVLNSIIPYSKLEDFISILEEINYAILAKFLLISGELETRIYSNSDLPEIKNLYKSLNKDIIC